MEQITISNIQRNLHKLNDFEIVEVIDKKKNEVKGYYLDKKYLFFVEELLQKIEDNKKTKKSLRGIFHKYADKNKISKEKDAWKDSLIKKHTYK